MELHDLKEAKRGESTQAAALIGTTRRREVDVPDSPLLSAMEADVLRECVSCETPLDSDGKAARFAGEKQDLVLGTIVQAARGLFHYMNVPGEDRARLLSEGVAGIVREVRTLPIAAFGTPTCPVPSRSAQS